MARPHRSRGPVGISIATGLCAAAAVNTAAETTLGTQEVKQRREQHRSPEVNCQTKDLFLLAFAADSVDPCHQLRGERSKPWALRGERLFGSCFHAPCMPYMPLGWFRGPMVVASGGTWLLLLHDRRVGIQYIKAENFHRAPERQTHRAR